jgi:hypothetical protein
VLVSKTASSPGQVGLAEGEWPNAPRPSNSGPAPPQSLQAVGGGVIELSPDMDEFEDARDQGVLGSDESDMELVGETPPGPNL